MKNKILLLVLFLLVTLANSTLCVYALDNNLVENVFELGFLSSFHDRISGALIVLSVVIVSWIILFIFLLKPEKKADNVNLADRYREVSLEELDSVSIDIQQFRTMIYQKFKDIHIAFSNDDYDNLKINLTNDLYKYYIFEIEELKKKNQKNIMKDFELVNFKIYQINNIDGKVRLDIYLNVRMIDYVLDMNNNAIIKGNNNEKMDFEFELTFVKNAYGKSMYEQYVMSKKTCVNVMSVHNNKEDKK